jgi:hypothetical protein
MKSILLSGFAAAVIATVSSAGAAPLKPMVDNPADDIIRVQEYQLPFELRFGSPDQNQDSDYRDDWNDESSYRDSDYDSDIKSPRWIARHLERNDYRVLSEPDLGPKRAFYRVMAINPDGREVKLLVGSRTGRIERIDFES